MFTSATKAPSSTHWIGRLPPTPPKSSPSSPEKTSPRLHRPKVVGTVNMREFLLLLCQEMLLLCDATHAENTEQIELKGVMLGLP